jgi:hypothetical protein
MIVTKNFQSSAVSHILNFDQSTDCSQPYLRYNTISTMPKNIEDIIPGDRRSIRSIPIPEGRRKINLNKVLPPEQAAAIPKRRVEDEAPLPRITAYRPEASFAKLPTHSSKKGIWITAILAILILGVAVFSLFKGATLTYTPKSSVVSFNKDSYAAFKSGDGNLIFSVIKLSGDKGTQAPASGQENVSVKASGTVLVYNNEKTSQKLVKTTRFQTSDGKIFRTPNDITIPPQKTIDGALTPGSTEVTLVADQPGADYNIAPSDFTIPGLKGTPRFTTMYARSKTPMTGGFVGVRKNVSAADLSTAVSGLQTALKNDLLTQARAQVPEDFILYPNLVSISYTDLPQTNPTDQGVTVNEHGDFYGIMFKKDDLAQFLASKKLTDAPTGVEIPELASLDISLINKNTDDLLKADAINFEVTGQGTIVSKTDESALQKDLAGMKKSDIPSVLSKYPSILNASAVIRPFWSSSFPTNPLKIKIVRSPLK